VPQTVTHAFRTVVAEAGAHVGYLISSAGFQSGAIDAAQSTNLKLVTWEQFQDELEPQWIQSHLLPTVTKELDPLFSYIEPINSAVYRGFESLTEERKEHFHALRGHYDKFGWTAMMFTTHFQQLGKGLPRLPLTRPADAEDDDFPPGYFEIDAWREFLEVTLQFGQKAIVELRGALDR
jgi:restriction system protein